MITFGQTVSGRLIRRYKRFLMDVQLDTGETVTAHCPNSGSLMGVCDPGMPVLLSYHPGPKRTYPLTAEMVYAEDTWIGINTQHPNRLVKAALSDRVFPEIVGYTDVKPETTVGQSRLDFFLPQWGYVEVKNAHMKRQPGLLEFPDAVTARGAKHLKELTHLTTLGHHAALIYIGQRADVDRFTVARDIDPTYAAAFEAAQKAGVMMLAYTCTVSPAGIALGRGVPCGG
jgi:sugar fermentation stimulation protein A